MKNKSSVSARVWILLAAVTAAAWTGCIPIRGTDTASTDTSAIAPETLGCGEWVHRRIQNGDVIGKGNTKVLILAAIGGGEPAARTLARKLKTALENKPVPNREVILVIHQDEDIRRAFTENTVHPRSKALMQLVDRCRPERIISLRQLYLEGYDPDGPEEAFQIARLMSDYTYPDAAVSDLPTSPGSLGSFGERESIPVITLAISSRDAEAGGDHLWLRFGYPLLAAIRYPDAPDDTPFHNRIERGIGYLNAGNVDNAIRTFQALRVRDPSRVEVTEYLFQTHLMAARQAQRSGNLNSARLHIQEALKIRPDCRDCKLLRNQIAAADTPVEEMPEEDNSEKAQPDTPLETAAVTPPAPVEPEQSVQQAPIHGLAEPKKADPDQAEVLLTEAKARIQAGNYAQAEDILKSALNADPDCDTCREYLNRARESAAALQAGLAHLEASAYKPAIIQFNWIRDNNPGDPNLIPHLVAAHSGFGHQLFAKGAYEEAGEQFEKALELDESCNSCMTRFDESLEADMSMKNATFLFEQGEYEQAIPKFSNVLRLNPDDRSARQHLSSAHRNRGEKLCESEEWIGGISHFQSALAADPDCSECKNLLRDCIRAFNTRQYRKAKDLVVKQKLKEALTELTQVPAEHREAEVRDLIERLKPFAVK